MTKCGWLKKRRETDRFRKRWCILRQDSNLEYRDTKTSSKASLVIPLSGALLKRAAGIPFAFEIHSPALMRKNRKNKEGRLYFQADDEVGFNEWFSLLRSCVGSTE